MYVWLLTFCAGVYAVALNSVALLFMFFVCCLTYLRLVWRFGQGCGLGVLRFVVVMLVTRLVVLWVSGSQCLRLPCRLDLWLVALVAVGVADSAPLQVVWVGFAFC